jgi:hypothetical protein
MLSPVSPADCTNCSLDLGAKVLAALSGGTISLWGRPAAQRWVKLGATYNASSTTLVLSTPFHGWAVNQTLVVTSSTYNPQQHEYTVIKGIAADGMTLTISPALTYGRYISVKSYTGARDAVDLRVEVGGQVTHLQQDDSTWYRRASVRRCVLGVPSVPVSVQLGAKLI